MPAISGIYRITNSVNGKIYIGSSIDMEKRFKTHVSKLINGYHDNQHLQASWNKYGKDNFIFEQLITCHPDLLIFYEQQFIDQWKPEYNKRIIASSNKGIKLQESTKEKIRQANLGKKHSISTKEKCAIASSKSKRNVKTHSIVLLSPDGIVYRDIYNMAKFCREHGIKQKYIWNITSGKTRFYHGWSVIQKGDL